MDLYLITPPQTRKDELPLVCHFLAGGLHKLHIRKPDYTNDEYRQYIRSIPPSFHHRLVLHGAHDLLPAFPAVGLHLRSHERQNTLLLQSVLQQRPVSLSSSFHAWQEIMADTTLYDYVFISPVFDSISKQGYKASIDAGGYARLKQWAVAHQRTLPPVVALGGVDAAGLSSLRENGFDGAALLGAVWESANPADAFEAVLKVNDNRAGF